MKIIGKEGLYFKGLVCVFEGEEVMLLVLFVDFVSLKGIVIVICGEGFKGGFGMFEMFIFISVVIGVGFGKEVVLLIDG